MAPSNRDPQPAVTPSAVVLEEVRRVCGDADYSVEGLLSLLGQLPSAALLRGDLMPARRRLADEESTLGRLARLFLLGERVRDSPDLEPLVAAGLLARDAAAPAVAPATLRAVLDLRPYGEWLVVSDLGSDVTGAPVHAEHVLGVGPASLTLAIATPRTPVGSALDVGTGSGVQALHLAAHAASVQATDSSARALRLAAMTFALSGVDVRLARGDLLAPVRDRRFDLIVANPPFVVGPPRNAYSYRDAGRAGDGVTEALVRGTPARLNDGGTAILLASWLHVAGEDWRDRLAGWLAGSGCDAWVAEREAMDPAAHTALWLSDSGAAPDLATSTHWLSWFEEHRIEAIGTGVIALRRAQGGDASFSVVDEPGAPVTGDETAGRLQRSEWLRRQGADLLAAVVVPGAQVSLHQEAVVGGQGWEVTRQVLRCSGRLALVDPVGVELLGACDGTRSIGELLQSLGTEHGLTPGDAHDVVTRLIRHGLLVPREPAGTAQ